MQPPKINRKAIKNHSQNNQSNPTRSISILLFIGIMFMPYIFSWFTLRKGYSTKARVFSLIWIVGIFIMFANDTRNKKLKQNKIISSNKVVHKKAVKPKPVIVKEKQIVKEIEKPTIKPFELPYKEIDIKKMFDNFDISVRPLKNVKTFRKRDSKVSSRSYLEILKRFYYEWKKLKPCIYHSDLPPNITKIINSLKEAEVDIDKNINPYIEEGDKVFYIIKMLKENETAYNKWEYKKKQLKEQLELDYLIKTIKASNDPLSKINSIYLAEKFFNTLGITSLYNTRNLNSLKGRCFSMNLKAVQPLGKGMCRFSGLGKELIFIGTINNKKFKDFYFRQDSYYQVIAIHKGISVYKTLLGQQQAIKLEIKYLK